MKRQMLLSILLLQLIMITVRTYVNPVQGLYDAPDPGVYRDVDGTYYAAVTGGTGALKFPIYKSKNMTSWVQVSSAMLEAPIWTDNTDFWAPQIHLVGKKYVLYFTARNQQHKLCIGASWSYNIKGPYFDMAHEPLWQHEDIGIIDATYYNTGNKNYLIYKTDGNAVGRPTQIYAVELTSDGLKVVGQKVLFLRNSLSFEAGIIEAPWIIFQNNYFYLFYSACGYANKCYSVSVARSQQFLGPYEKYNRPILSTRNPETQDSLEGPGHCSVVKGINGNWAMVYHAWPHGRIGTKRVIMLDQISWTADKWPYIGSPSENDKPIP